MTIVISDKPGQLANLIFLYASFLANSKNTGAKILNPAFYNYYHYFEFTASKNKTTGKLLYYLCNTFSRILGKLRLPYSIALNWNESLNMDRPEEFERLAKPLVFVRGWQYRSNLALLKYKTEITGLFAPRLMFKTQLEQFFDKNFKDKAQLRIGLHVRRGDYAVFENGKYFYSLGDYKKIVARLPVVFAGKNIKLLICSNENFTTDEVCPPGITAVKGPGHELLDLYSLSMCQYILGPPSTYSMWASFYGNVPLYAINDPNSNFVLNDFKIFEPH